MSPRTCSAVAVAAVTAVTTLGSADIIALVAELYDYPIIDDELWSAWRLYVETDGPEQRIAIVAGRPGDPGLIQTDGVFYQHPFGGDIEHPASLDGSNPGLHHDTYLTIGSTDSATSAATRLTPGWPGFSPAELLLDNDGWFRSPDDPKTIPDSESRVLVGQFTIPYGAQLAGVNLAVAGPGAIVYGAWFSTDGTSGFAQIFGDGDFGADGAGRLGKAIVELGDIDWDGIDDYAIAAPHAAGGRGKVSVYSGEGDLIRAYLGDEPGDRLGWSLAASDVNADTFPDLVIGVPYDDNLHGENAGLVYVYSGLDGHLLHAFVGKSAGDRFGWAVAGGDDLDGDLRPDVVVGAPNADDAGKSTGRVTVFSGIDGSIAFERRGKSRGDRFGYAVAVLPRAGKPGLFAVGAPWYDGAEPNCGRVTVFNGKSFTVRYRRTGQGKGDHFGFAVADVGGIDGDGTADLGIGAPDRARAGHAKSGRVYVYSGASGDRLFARGGPFGSRFGFSIAGAGDVDCDGTGDILAGAPRHNGPAGANSGLARVISGATGATIMVSTGAGPGHQYGRAVAGLGDMDGDGLHEILVTAPHAGPNMIGQLYVLSVESACGGEEAQAGPGIPVLPGRNPAPPITLADRADLDADGDVDVYDLVAVIAEIGTPGDLADLDRDGAVTRSDLAVALGRFGAIDAAHEIKRLPVRITRRPGLRPREMDAEAILEELAREE